MKLIKLGVLTANKNLGNFGERHLGINPSGVMDKFAARLLNALLQKDENSEVLEMYFPGPEILFEEDCFIIIGGADFTPLLDNQIVTNWKLTKVSAGSILRFKKKVAGNITYLAVKSSKSESIFLSYLGNILQPQFSKQLKNKIRFIAGNEHQLLTENSKQNLENQPFVISQNANRMGFRMKSEALELETKIELVSAAVDFGTVQLLPDGQIIILMADHQTSGGYPRIGHVISVDLPKLAQMEINEVLYFEQISVEEAENLIISQEKEFQKLKSSIRFFNEYKSNNRP